MDMRFRAVVAWFAAQMETLFAAGNTVAAPPDFDAEIRNKKSGLEIFCDVMVDGLPATAVFVLSPHWRY